ncbi:MAG: type II and III secretion system protein family protein [Xanthobacteraceae bacterium]|jgi:pilus assembly protein CpaC
MTTGTSIRAAFIAVLAVAAWTVPYNAASAGASNLAAEPQIPGVSLVSDNAHTRSATLKIGKSLVLDFPRDIKDVLVSNPTTANAVIRSLRRAYIMGNAAGETNIVFFDADGKQMADFEITVPGPVKKTPSRDVRPIISAIQRYVPNSHVIAESVGDGIILSGTVANQLEAQQAYDIAVHFIDPCAALLGNNDSGSSGSSSGSSSSSSVTFNSSGCEASGPGSSGSGGGVKGALNGISSSKIVNLIVVLGRDQVMLKVTVAEMDRNVIKQLGINLTGSAGFGSAVVNFNTSNPFPINGTPSSSVSPGFKGITATIQAMEQVGIVRTLAEPTLAAISGESAHFLVGGSFPYPVPASLGQPPAIQFQNYGVALNFTPVVLSEGRISLHVATEVSQLDSTNSVTIAGTTVPALTVRRADTTVEIPSGGTLAMAGMLQEQTKQDITGLPGLMQLPILGTLFKSNDYLNSQTELVALVTPYVVRAVAQKDLSRPDDGFADPSDPATVLLGRLNRIYGVGGIPDPPDNYRGKYGFILD